ncbi:hypothetical protein [Pontibacter pamirensis]|uniref:hypothetical protein n=1 Tax=Pontibacter pamirensis TaxID=2562824 RepID=UPI00138A48B1|nr:hypothetical protein [Pontibacter pamirensis]
MISSVSSSPIKTWFRTCAVLALLLLESCAVTDTVVSRNTSDQPERARHLSHVGATHWSYLWGLLPAENWDAGCQPGSDMTRVRVRTNPLFITVSFLSLGLVVPQRLEWDCAPPNRGTGTIGTDGADN